MFHLSHHTTHAAARAQARSDRDAALVRVRRVRGGVIAVAAGLTAGFAALVSALAPGRTLGAIKHSDTAGSPVQTADVATNVRLRMPSLAGPAQLGLQGPGSAPVAQTSSPASSGAGASSGSQATSSSQAAAAGSSGSQAAPTQAASPTPAAVQPAPVASAPAAVSGGS